jgi:signal transduction histidine kinase/CheY-like chemotaxis protein
MVKLLEQEVFFQNLFQMIPLIIMMLDDQGRIIKINNAAREFIEENSGILEYQDLFGGDVFHCIHRHDHAQGCTHGSFCNECDVRLNSQQALKGNSIVRAKGTITIENNGKINNLHLLISTSPVDYLNQRYALVVIEDITEKIILEEEIFKAQKLESVGMLAGGIAHDFNNYLAGILSNIQLVGLRLKHGSDVQGLLKKTEDVIIRATGLTQQLLALSKGGAPVKKIVSLKDMIIDTVIFVLSGKEITCEFQIPDDLWSTEVDINQIAQVITNLLINASQAMPKGIITIQCENVVLGAPNPFLLKAGEYIKVTITDQGCGISKENQSKIFDPFFSTKEKGSGLGLTVCYSIIRNHQGYIGVESSEGNGATFYFYLPAISKPLFLKVNKAEDLHESGEQGKILFMDDEKNIALPLCEMLSEAGYEVKLVAEGSEVINEYQKAQEDGNPYDAVILDLTIPHGMGGEQTIQQLIKINPEVKAVVSSGYSDNPVLANPLRFHFKEVVIKPYKVEELRRILRKILGEK